MLYTLTIISILEVLAVTIPVLLTVAFITIAERKTMASMQRRLGPNSVGWYGLLQAFADALKLLLKEYVAPTQANIILFFLGPIITLIFSLLGYAVIPYGPGLVLLDFNLGILYMLAMSSLSTYGILLAGWSANSKYAFLGSLRSTAQLISYELILSSAILLIVMLAGSLDLTLIIESQRSIWYIGPLLPVFLVFFIGSIAETNRAPFDLAEAESELVSGFMTEHSAVIFVFFFLAEYASIVLICIVNSILFIGGYLFNFNYYLYPYFYLLKHISGDNYMYLANELNFQIINFDQYPVIIGGIIYGTILGLKGCIMIFTFIWARASFPRIRYDQLMSYCWTILLPIVISLIILIPCILYSIEIIPCNIPVLCDGYEGDIVKAFMPTLVLFTGDSSNSFGLNPNKIDEFAINKLVDLRIRLEQELLTRTEVEEFLKVQSEMHKAMPKDSIHRLYYKIKLHDAYLNDSRIPKETRETTRWFYNKYNSKLMFFITAVRLNIFPLLGVIPLLITLGWININLTFYIPEFIYNMLPEIKYEIFLSGPLALWSVRRFIKQVILVNKLVDFIQSKYIVNRRIDFIQSKYYIVIVLLTIIVCIVVYNL